MTRRIDRVGSSFERALSGRRKATNTAILQTSAAAAAPKRIAAKRKPKLQVASADQARAAAGVFPLATTASPADRQRSVKSNAMYSFEPMRGGRQTQPGNYNPFGLTGWYFIPKRQYQDIDVEELDIGQFSADELLSILPDLNPDFSIAVWNYLRVAGTEVNYTAVTPDGKEDPRAQKVLDDLIIGLNPQWGGIEAIHRQLLLSAYLMGAVSIDVAPTANLKDVDDIFPVSPDSIWFQRDDTQKLVAFQRQAIWGNLAAAYPYRLMNEETFFFSPVDPFIDDPYGRAPAAPALQVVFGVTNALRDLQKVIHMQGWPRIDLELVYEVLEPTMPAEVLDDEGKKYAWMVARMNDVVAAYNNLAPEDAFVHWDFVKVNPQKEGMSVGGSRGGILADAGALIQVFRDQLIVGLKSLPIFHGGGNAKGDTETYGTVEYEIYTAAVDTLRQIVSNTMTRGLTVAMQLRGIQTLVHSEWAPIKTTERLNDALAEATEIENEVNKRDQGWQTQDDASNAITDSDAVGPAPAAAPLPLAPLKAIAQQAPKGSPNSPLGGATDENSAVPGSGNAKEPGPAPKPETLVGSGRGMAYAMVRALQHGEISKMLERYV